MLEHIAESHTEADQWPSTMNIKTQLAAITRGIRTRMAADIINTATRITMGGLFSLPSPLIRFLWWLSSFTVLPPTPLR